MKQSITFNLFNCFFLDKIKPIKEKTINRIFISINAFPRIIEIGNDEKIKIKKFLKFLLSEISKFFTISK